MEILVHGDIEKALTRLKRNYQKDLSKDVARHVFFESRSVRKRRKRKKAMQRLKKLEARSNTRVTEAIRRGARDPRKTGMDYEWLKPVQAQQI